MTQLPTFQSGEIAFAAYRESLIASLASDQTGAKLALLFYAVTELGWSELKPSIIAWSKRLKSRRVVAYVGTDHAITDPQALQQMSSDGVDVRLLVRYRGIYHPKVVWLSGPRHHLVWVGSNNLTREGLLNNIECATLVKSTSPHPDFQRWVQAIDQASTSLTPELLNEYQRERDAYGAARVAAGTFTWSRKEEPPAPPPVQRRRRQQPPPDPPALPAVAQPGDLLIEVMPRETGQGGKQVQLPKAAGVQYFGLADRIGASRQIRLSYQGGHNPRMLTMTIFDNNTIRLVLNELDYRDRPCVIVFHRTAPNDYQYEIVQRSILPTRYRRILDACVRQTRTGSRRWGIA